MRIRHLVVGPFVAIVAACGPSSSPGNAAKADGEPMVVETTDGTVDSAFTRSEALRRVRARLAAPESLANTAPSREALVDRVSAALSRSDTAGLRALALTPAEWAYFYYPEAGPLSVPATMGPRMAFGMSASGSTLGSSRLLEDAVKDGWTVLGYRCLGTERTEGNNVVIGPCGLKVARARKGDTVEVAFANQLMTREGRTKIVTFPRDATLREPQSRAFRQADAQGNTSGQAAAAKPAS